MKEATEVVAEQPKGGKGRTKTGENPAASTTVEGAEKKPRSPRVATTMKYRILDGVDPEKFRGQRQIVVKALQSLGGGYHSVKEIAAKCEGLVSKTPVEASANYHLKALVANKEVEPLVEADPVANNEQAAA